MRDLLAKSIGMGSLFMFKDIRNPVFDDIKQFLSELFSDSYGQ